MWRLVALSLVISGCGGFVPAYNGEPECGSVRVIHATRGEPCEGTPSRACDCADRETLKCEAGVWTYERWGCAVDGLGTQAD